MRNYNLYKFVKEFNLTKVYYDPRFQRRVVWDKKNSNSFFESFTKGWALTSIVVLDIDKCRSYCTEIGDYTSAKYYEQIFKKGFTHISLDGQNRSKKLEAFYKNELSISGEFVDADGLSHAIVNSFFKDLPERLQDHFKTGCAIPIQVVETATQEEAALIFKALNDGEPLNAQEKRQATSTPIADLVRELSKEHQEFLKRILPEKKIRRMEDDELVANILMALMKNFSFGKKTWDFNTSSTDDFYALGEGFCNLKDPSCPYLLSEVERAREILDNIATTVLQQKMYSKTKPVPKKFLWATVLACEYIWDNEFEIRNYSKFFERLVAIDKALAVASETDYADKRKEALSAGLDPDTVVENGFYHKWQNLPHQVGQRHRRADALISEIDKNLKSLTLRKKADTVSNAA